MKAEINADSYKQVETQKETHQSYMRKSSLQKQTDYRLNSTGLSFNREKPQSLST